MQKFLKNTELLDGRWNYFKRRMTWLKEIGNICLAKELPRANFNIQVEAALQSHLFA